MLAAENIQRQITIAVVVTMEEPALLFSMQRQIGGIDIDNHLFRRLVMRFDEHRHQQLIETVFPECDFLVPIRHAVAEFHPIQVLLPAKGLFRSFRPDKTPNSGSSRRSSWSF